MCTLIFSQYTCRLLELFLQITLSWVIAYPLAPANSKCLSFLKPCSLSLQLRKMAELYLSSCFLHLRLEITSIKKALTMVGLTSFFPHSSGITVLCCLLCSIWKSLSLLFCPFFSLFTVKYTSRSCIFPMPGSINFFPPHLTSAIHSPYILSTQIWSYGRLQALHGLILTYPAA